MSVLPVKDGQLDAIRESDCNGGRRAGRGSLSIRLAVWAVSRGWRLKIGVEPDTHQVSATVGPVTGRGRTANEALDDLADGLAAREGWPDDRRVPA